MQIIVIAHNVRSAHNVGSILRTCDCLGIKEFFATGYTPYPDAPEDQRLPHIRRKLTADIHKTALGAELVVPIRHFEALAQATEHLRKNGFTIFALEQDTTSIFVDKIRSSYLTGSFPQKIALIVGNEPQGLTKEELSTADKILEIRMFGHKESFNVSVAAGIALYELTKSS